jgi:hypothetical protein
VHTVHDQSKKDSPQLMGILLTATCVTLVAQDIHVQFEGKT